MNWDRVNSHCIQSGDYEIKKCAIGGQVLYLTYYRGDPIGDSLDGNKARRVAIKHADKQGVES